MLGPWGWEGAGSCPEAEKNALWKAFQAKSQNGYVSYSLNSLSGLCKEVYRGAL